jgi:hypothetical protein
MINSSGPQRLRAISPYMEREDAISVAQQLQRYSRSTSYRLIDIRLEVDPTDPTRARIVATSELIAPSEQRLLGYHTEQSEESGASQ